MNKRQRRGPAPRSSSAPAAPRRPPNRQLPSQTRKVLAKHYRAKYGVR